MAPLVAQPDSVEEYVSAKERAERGRAARKATPRRAHADWEPSATRPDPIAILEEQAATRIPELVPIRHGRMLVSPFAFFRGAAAIMAADLAGTPDSGFQTQLCGDAHLSNFGIFGTPERKFVFDINDFDETHPGPVGVGREAPGRELRGGAPASAAGRGRCGGGSSAPPSASTGRRCRRSPRRRA